MTTPLLTLVLLALLGSPSGKPHAVPGKADGGVLEYEKIAKEWAAAHKIEAATPEAVRWEDVVAKVFVHGRFGLFDVCFPADELEKNAENLRLCVDAMLDGQAKWLDWAKTSTSDQKALRDDLKLLDAFVKGWKVASLAHAKDAGGKDLFDLMGASELQRAAGTRFTDAMARGVALGLPREDGATSRIVLAPTRKTFTELTFFCGWIDPMNRAGFWQDSAADWLQCFVGDDQIIALQYSNVGHAPTDYVTGSGLNQRDPDVMQQQIVQLATQSLLLAHYKDRVPNAFIGGLAMNLVIDVFDEVNTRVDGDTRSKVTQKREVFVPGGNSDGGFLPKNSAETRWRELAGKDHFIAILHGSQEAGAKLLKESKNKAACFAIRSDDDGKQFAVCAPFMGSAGATATVPPAEFLGDFAEMLRAYKSAFIYWLQCKSAATDKVSREKFAQLLCKLADPNATDDFESIFKLVYDGAPLSSPGADKESLEGRFLIWLAKQK